MDLADADRAAMALAGIGVIDAHIHQWDRPNLPRRRFGTVAGLLRRIASPVRRDASFGGDPEVYRNPYLPADYRRDLGDVPVEALVHIEAGRGGPTPAARVAETRWVASLPFGVDTPALGAIIGGADPADPGFATLLDAHRAASPLFRGVRATIAHHPDPGVHSFTDAAGAATTRAFLNGFAALAQRELVFEAFVYAHQIPEVGALAQRYPEVTVVLNHLGTPAGIFGPVGRHTGADATARQQLFLRWRDDIATLATYPNVVAKLSGLAMPILGHPVPAHGVPTPVADLLDRAAPLLQHAFDTFGTRRLLWGSNYPVDKPMTSIANSAALVIEVLTDRGGDAVDLERIFRVNAQGVYGIDPELTA